MKKIILSLAIASLSTAAMAQVSLGVKAGANFSTLRGDDVSNVKSKFGANGGLFANIFMSDMLSLQPEILYSMEGAKSKSNADSRLDLNYVNFPIMLKINIADGFYGEFGPQIGILTSAKAENNNVSVDVKDGYKDVNLSVAAGLGYNFTPAVGIGARYNYGVNGITKEVAGMENDTKTGTLSVGLHYMFGK